jgi:4-amino-4-deoxychorismate lyase
MSRFIETIRFSGGKFQNLGRHVDRILRALNGQPRWDIDSMLSEAASPGDNVYKIRIVYDRDIASVSTELYTIRAIRTLKLVVDNNIVYDHKFEDRSALARLYSQREGCDDVLIVKNGVITDTSYSNIIFREGSKWFTPGTFLLNGTMRQYLLDTGAITEMPISPSDLPQFSHFKLINAMLRDEAQESEVSNIR